MGGAQRRISAPTRLRLCPAAVNGFRAVFDHLVATRSAVDAQFDAAEEA